jgi:hypothetical protein
MKLFKWELLPKPRLNLLQPYEAEYCFALEFNELVRKSIAQ